MNADGHGCNEARRAGIIVDDGFQIKPSSVRSDITVAVRKDYAAPTELCPSHIGWGRVAQSAG